MKYADQWIICGGSDDFTFFPRCSSFGVMAIPAFATRADAEEWLAKAMPELRTNINFTVRPCHIVPLLAEASQ